MGRLLLISAILFLIWMGYRFLNKTWSARVKEIEKKAEQQPSQAKPVEQIKACVYCKTHIPENEGIYEEGQFFCSYQHLDSYLKHQ